GISFCSRFFYYFLLFIYFVVFLAMLKYTIAFI
ncbi:hypothetical protein A5848_000430, partial [Enterococcus faecium]